MKYIVNTMEVELRERVYTYHVEADSEEEAREIVQSQDQTRIDESYGDNDSYDIDTKKITIESVEEG